MILQGAIALRALRSNRDEQAARKLWNSLPPVYRQASTMLPELRSGDAPASAVAYTDFWAAYGAVFPVKRHQAQRVRAERP